MSVNHQNGEESSEVRSSVAAARFTLDQRREAVRVAVQTQKVDAEVSLCAANDTEARISAVEQKVSERESTRAAADAAEEDVHVEAAGAAGSSCERD